MPKTYKQAPCFPGCNTFHNQILSTDLGSYDHRPPAIFFAINIEGHYPLVTTYCVTNRAISTLLNAAILSVCISV